MENEVTSEDPIRFQKEKKLQRLMFKELEQSGDQYFSYKKNRGWSITCDFYVQKISQKREPTESELIKKEVQELQNQLACM